MKFARRVLVARLNSLIIFFILFLIVKSSIIFAGAASAGDSRSKSACRFRLASLVESHGDDKNIQTSSAKQVADLLTESEDLRIQDQSWDPVRDLLRRLKENPEKFLSVKWNRGERDAIEARDLFTSTNQNAATWFRKNVKAHRVAELIFQNLPIVSIPLLLLSSRVEPIRPYIGAMILGILALENNRRRDQTVAFASALMAIFSIAWGFNAVAPGVPGLPPESWREPFQTIAGSLLGCWALSNAFGSLFRIKKLNIVKTQVSAAIALIVFYLRLPYFRIFELVPSILLLINAYFKFKALNSTEPIIHLSESIQSKDTALAYRFDDSSTEEEPLDELYYLSGLPVSQNQKFLRTHQIYFETIDPETKAIVPNFLTVVE